jgi:hypothetical protein
MFTYVFFCYSIPLKELRANIRFREGFRCVIKDSALSIRPRKPNLFRRIFVQKTTFLCINNVVEISVVSIRPRKQYMSNNYLDFLGEFEAIFKTDLAHESRP